MAVSWAERGETERNWIWVLFGTDDMVWTLTEVVVTQHCECRQCHRTAHFKSVGFMLCELPLNQKKK